MQKVQIKAKKAGTDLFDFPCVTPVTPGINAQIVTLPDSQGRTQGESGYTGPVVQVGSFPTLDKDADSVTTVEETTNAFGHGIATVDTAGTDEPISATSLVVKWVILQAIPGQSGEIAIGGQGVDATATTGTGIILGEGDSVPFGPCNLGDIYQDATITGNGVRYVYGV